MPQKSVQVSFIFNFHCREKYQLQNKCKKYSQIYISTHLSEPAASIILAAFTSTSFTLKHCPPFFSCFGALCSSFQSSKALHNHLPYIMGFFQIYYPPICALVVVSALPIPQVFILLATSIPFLHFVYSCTFY